MGCGSVVQSMLSKQKVMNPNLAGAVLFITHNYIYMITIC